MTHDEISQLSRELDECRHALDEKEKLLDIIIPVLQAGAHWREQYEEAVRINDKQRLEFIEELAHFRSKGQ